MALKLTGAEALQVIGRLAERLGDALDNDGRISSEEIQSILQSTITDFLAELTD